MHPELEVGARCSFASDGKSRKNVNADVFLADHLAVLLRNGLPSRFWIGIRFPDEATSRVDSSEWVPVGEGFRVTAENDVNVVEFAVHADAIGSYNEEVVGG